MANNPVISTSIEMPAERLSHERRGVFLAAPVLLSALLFIACFPPWHLRGLAWVCLIPLLVCLQKARLPTAVALAGAWGMIAAYGVTDWLPEALSVYYQQPLWLGMGLFLAASALMGAADYMVFAGFYWWAARRGIRFVPLFAGAAWVVAELGRSRLFTGNPWGLIGYSQLGLTASAMDAGFISPFVAVAERVVQVADVAGVYGIGFVIVAVNAWLADIGLALVARQRMRRVCIDGACVMAVLAACLAYGQLRISQPPGGSGPPVEVAIIQGNLDLGARWNSSMYGRNLDTYLRLTQQAVSTGEPKLVVWPENAMTFFVDDEPAYRYAIARVTMPATVQLVAGAPRYENSEAPVFHNSAFLLAPSGATLAHYDKEHLLPFAEYFPFHSVEYLQRSFGRVREFTPGEQTAPLPTVAGKAGILICNEAMFPRIVVGRMRDRVDVLINLSNDSWVASREFAEHQFNMVSLRAVEHRRYMIRSSTSGPSAIIDPLGRVVVRTKPFTADTLSGQVRPLTYTSFYSRHGDLFAFLCLALVVLRCLAALSASRRPPAGRDRSENA